MSATMPLMSEVDNILLTGATGVMGGRLLQEILSLTQAQVYCLIRADNPAEAKRRIEEVLFCYDERRELASQTWRIVPVLGDVAKPRLGLEESVWRELAQSIDLVLHCAASVNLVSSYAKIAPVNVGGTKNIAQLCLAAGTPLLYASSFSVLGDKLYQEITLHEDDLDIGQRFPEMDYERSKFESEKALHEFGKHGLDFVIVRPGNIWGDSRTGCYPLFQTRVKGLYYEAIRSLVETGLTFASNEDFDITPVDYVARASLHIALHWRSHNRRTFQLVNPEPISWDVIAAQVRDYGYTVRDLPRQSYFDALKEGRILRGGKAYRSTFTDLLSVFGDSDYIRDLAKYATVNARAALAGTDIECHPCDGALMARYLDYAVAQRFLPSPQDRAPLAEVSVATVRGGFMEQLYDADLSESLHS